MSTDTAKRRAGRQKGRRASSTDILQISGYLDQGPGRRDHLIEYLHRVQDDIGYLPARLLVALAHELSLAPAEIYEVATFYHHFDLVKENDTPPPPLTVRICESVSCAMAGANALPEPLQRALGDGVRVQKVPCVGRCEAAPVAVVGRCPVERATVETIRTAVDRGACHDACPETAVDLETYRSQGGYRTLQKLLAAGSAATDETVIQVLDDARPWRLGFSGRAQVAHRARLSGTPPDGRQYR